MGKDIILDEIKKIKNMNFEEKINKINEIKLLLHEISPFNREPVDCVIWVKSDNVVANDYNPNSVAPPEMKLLELSIDADGFTQPVVTFFDKKNYEVVDGFHRNRISKESENVRNRLNGYMPIVVINDDRSDKSDRMASTIRHNRARGKHKIDGMTDIVVELKRRNWSDKKIGKNLGMDQDEVLRLAQISGLAEMFKDDEFSKSWDLGNVEYEEIQIEDKLEE